MKQLLNVSRVTFLILSIAGIAGVRIAHAADTLDKDARAALNALYESQPAAKALGEKAKAVLVFPSIDKAALLVGGQSGKGVLFSNGNVAGHYRADGVIGGLEVGVQSFSYAMFFMSDIALKDLHTLRGFEIGADPNIVLVDGGAGKEYSTTTVRPDVYSYVYNQKGVMGGIALQGLKITQLEH